MPVGGVIDDEIDDDANAALLGAVGELDKVAERAIGWIDAVVVGDIVAIVAPGEGWKGISQIAVTPSPCR